MSEHTMKLDDLYHRSLKLDTELCDTASTDISVIVIYKKSPSGNFTNFICVKSLANPQAFTDLEIPAGGIKIPPQVPED
jgi:hypothetical protein